jgi:hypothetical protein
MPAGTTTTGQHDDRNPPPAGMTHGDPLWCPWFVPSQGSARVIRCLQAQRDKLTLDCQATLFDEEVRFSDNIDFQYPMKVACKQEMATFCKNIPHGQARVIR